MDSKTRMYIAKHSTLKGSAKSVLLAIAEHAKDDGTGAYPSVATIARHCAIDPSTVHRALRLARESGELSIQYNLGPKGTNLYSIRLENIGSQADRQAAGIVPPRKKDTPGIMRDKGS